MHRVLSANLDTIVMAHLEPGEDLMGAITEAARLQSISAGVVLSITGTLTRARLQRFTSESPARLEVLDIEGPMEVSGTGILGKVRAPQMGSKPFTQAEMIHGDPYVHVHLTVTTAEETICGHLMPGCFVRSKNPISHFTIFMASVKGAALDMTCSPDATPAEVDDARGIFHNISLLAGSA